jgi:hypothetical protein
MQRRIQSITFATLTTLVLWTGTGQSDSDGCCECTKQSILGMSREELCAYFKSLPEGDVPRAYYRGTLIGKGPAPVRVVTAGAVGIVWQGKYVMPDRGMMINKVCGQAKVTAELFTDASWLDGRPTTVFDYRCSSAKFARDARDEVRPVCPGLFLGLMWVRQPDGCPKLSTFFLLEKECNLTPPACESASTND